MNTEQTSKNIFMKELVLLVVKAGQLSQSQGNTRNFVNKSCGKRTRSPRGTELKEIKMLKQSGNVSKFS